MIYFTHAMPKEKIRKVVDVLLTICDDMDNFEDDMLNLEYLVTEKTISECFRLQCREQIDNRETLKNDIESVFQVVVSQLVDFNYLARNYTDDLLKEISQVNPEMLEEEAVNNMRR